MLSRSTAAARLKVEANGRRGGQAAFDHVAKHGYDAADGIFRELGMTLLSRWAQEGNTPGEVREAWLSSALSRFDALVADHRRIGKAVSPTPDVFDRLRDTASDTTRKFRFTTAAEKLSPRHWQQVLAAVERQMHARGVALPEGWRDELAKQMGRSGLDANTGLESRSNNRAGNAACRDG